MTQQTMGKFLLVVPLKMNNTVLAPHRSFHLNKAFVEHDHQLEAVYLRHHDHIGVANLRWTMIILILSMHAADT
jgi:hypothetical protein